MTTQELDTLLNEKRAEVAEINARIWASNPKSEERKVAVEYAAELGAEIASLKSQRHQMMLKAMESNKEAKQARQESAAKAVRICILHHVAEQRVSYFANNLDHIELLLMLEEVFGAEKPAIVSFLTVPAEDQGRIPAEWFELE
jgi:hypothetical protein